MGITRSICNVGAFAAALSLACPLAAEDSSPLKTGNDLLQTCTDTSNLVMITGCIGFISGVSRGTAAALETVNNRQFFCVPLGADNGQLTDIVVKWLRDHPEMRHHDATGLVIVALRGAFPCPP